MSKDIQGLVNHLLSKNGINKPPVAVEGIIENLGVTLKKEPLKYKGGTVSGMLFRDHGETIIGVNALETHTRKRFTIAHELGHYLLHQRKIYVDMSSEIYLRNELSSQAIDPAEIEANSFAAELLMPAKMVKKQFHLKYANSIKKNKFATLEEIIAALGKQFEVSIQAMTFRLANLGIISISS